MSDYDAQVDRWIGKVNEKKKRLHDAVVDAVLVSIKDGSPITGAPGQPIDEGDLYESWKRVDVEGLATRSAVQTTKFYAKWIEDGVKPKGQKLTTRSSKGGQHSVKLTKAGFPALVAQVTQEMSDDA